MRSATRLALLGVLLASCTQSSDQLEEPGWTRLPNGLRVFVRQVPHASDVVVVTWFQVGSDNDPPGKSGLAHLTEHVYVTSAAGNRPARTAESWAARKTPASDDPLIAALGETKDARTSAAATYFVATSTPDELDTELADAAARMGDLRIDPAVFERERHRVIDQIEASGQDGMTLALSQALDRVAPPVNHGRLPGMREDVEKLTPDDARDWWRRFYKPANARLLISGAVEPASALALVEKRFGNLPPGEPMPPTQTGPSLPGTIELPVPPAGLDATRTDRIVCIGFKTPGPADHDYAAWQLVMQRLAPQTAQPHDFAVAAADQRGATVVRWTGDGRPVEAILARFDEVTARCADDPPRDSEIAGVVKPWEGDCSTPDGKPFVPPLLLALWSIRTASAAQERIDFERLPAALRAVTREDLRRVVGKWLAPARRVVVVTTGE